MSVNFRIDALKSFEDVRDALQKIKEAFDGSVLEKGEFQFFKITLTSAVTNFKYSHKLNFTPSDVIQLSVVGVGAVTWNYGSFDKNYINLTTTGACVVRAYIGRHKEGSDA
jgi:hypothetical protein